MADFAQSLRKTLAVEKGWNNVPGDKGGETYKGIARNFHPSWAGWAIIDAIKNSLHLSPNLVHSDALDRVLESQSALPGQVEAFYREKFWAPLGVDKEAQAIADKAFDIAVNMSVEAAKKMLMQAEADAQ